MEDLLKEEEFLVTQHHPQKLFRRFYMLAVVQIIIVQLCISFLVQDANGVIMFLVYLLLPVVNAVWMFTSDSKNFMIPRKTKIKAVLWLVLCFSVANVLINIGKIVYRPTEYVSNSLSLQLFSSAAFFVVQFGVCLLVIRVVSRLVKKRIEEPLIKQL